MELLYVLAAEVGKSESSSPVSPPHGPKRLTMLKKSALVWGGAQGANTPG